jgi:hypothetical protein
LLSNSAARLSSMRQLAHDIRNAARALGKAPLFTAIAIISLGLALALNTSVFALADAVTHPAIPYPEPQRIVRPSFLGGPKNGLGFADRFRIVRDEMRAYEAIASFTVMQVSIEAGTLAEDHRVVAVSPNFFDVLGVRPVAGRSFGTADAEGGALQAAIISYRLWNRVRRATPLSASCLAVSTTLTTPTYGYPRRLYRAGWDGPWARGPCSVSSVMRAFNPRAPS